MSELLVIAGMSGAGRSQAANNLEDLGWFVMDNLPPSLIPKVAELADGSKGNDRLALVIGTGRFHEEIVPLVAGLRSGVDRLRLLFLDASTDVLIRRYESTRRRHPFSEGDNDNRSVSELIDAERIALGPLRTGADLVIDTTELNVHQLRDRIREAFNSDGHDSMRTAVTSFGYKHGIPLDVDLVFDCRFLPNPHWIEDLRPLTGLDEPVSRYVLEQPITGAFLARLDRLLAMLLPFYEQEGKSYLTVAFGCTGGRHRSVAIAERMSELLQRHGYQASVAHRDVEK